MPSHPILQIMRGQRAMAVQYNFAVKSGLGVDPVSGGPIFPVCLTVFLNKTDMEFELNISVDDVVRDLVSRFVKSGKLQSKSFAYLVARLQKQFGRMFNKYNSIKFSAITTNITSDGAIFELTYILRD